MTRVWFAVLVLVSSTPSWASTVYPQVLVDELELDQVPECVTCHLSSRGGPNTARKPFAQTLVAHGLTGGANVVVLREVLSELGDADSDADGVADVRELQRGSDPNDASSTPAQHDAGGTLSDASAPGSHSEEEAGSNTTTNAATASTHEFVPTTIGSDAGESKPTEAPMDGHAGERQSTSTSGCSVLPGVNVGSSLAWVWVLVLIAARCVHKLH